MMAFNFSSGTSEKSVNIRSLQNLLIFQYAKQALACLRQHFFVLF